MTDFVYIDDKWLFNIDEIVAARLKEEYTGSSQIIVELKDGHTFHINEKAEYAKKLFKVFMYDLEQMRLDHKWSK